MVQQFSFDFGDPEINAHGWRLSYQVITFENTYGMDPQQVTIAHSGKDHEMRSTRLMWAGNQEKAQGSAMLRASETEDGLEIVTSAVHTKTIRTSKITIHGLPDGIILGRGWHEFPIGEGVVYGWPMREDIDRMHTALVFLKTQGGDYYYFRSLDTQVRHKGFAIYYAPDGDGVTVELLHNDLGPEMTTHTEAPAWLIGCTRDPDAVVHAHMAHLEKHFNLVSWEENPRIPAWLRKIGLVAYIHGQHWTGYNFNDYDEMLRVLQNLAERYDGKRILAHLAGWEGRYYWIYGEAKPDERMGGEKAFRRLCEGAHKLGVHLQLMLGGNCAHTGTPNFPRWGTPSIMRTEGGAELWGNKPDWDTSRTRDTFYQAWLNPGAPGWHNHLLETSTYLVEQYGIDSIFLDTYGVWTNDPSNAVYPGLVRLRDELKARYPDVFFTGEQWWDVLAAVSPLTHDDGLYLGRWWEFFYKYSRGYAFNGWGDPSRNSTGVFEGGYQPFKQVPDSPYLIPSLVVVDGTLEKAPQRVEEIIQQAKRWTERYLKD
jgi:hypothetical protein